MKNSVLKFYSKYKITLLFSSVLILTGICLLAITNGFYKLKVENKIIEKIKGYEFSENSKLAGLSVDFKDVKCEGLFLYDCHIKDFQINFKSEMGYFTFLESDKTVIKPKSITNIFSFYIESNNVKLGEVLEKNIFSYDEEPYKSIGENLKKYFFPAKMIFEVDMKKRSKNKADGTFRIEFENNTSKVKLNSNIFLDNREYNEVIPVEAPEGYEGKQAEIISNNVPFFAKLDHINYYIEDVDFKGFIYEVYKLNAYNLKREQPWIMPEYNMFYLGIDKDEILEKAEFEEAFKKMINSYINSIPEEEKSFKLILSAIEKVLNKEVSSIEIQALNKGNTTLEKTGLLFMIDNINTTRKYLDESFEIKIKENK